MKKMKGNQRRNFSAPAPQPESGNGVCCDGVARRSAAGVESAGAVAAAPAQCRRMAARLVAAASRASAIFGTTLARANGIGGYVWLSGLFMPRAASPRACRRTSASPRFASRTALSTAAALARSSANSNASRNYPWRRRRGSWDALRRRHSGNGGGAGDLHRRLPVGVTLCAANVVKSGSLAAYRRILESSMAGGNVVSR